MDQEITSRFEIDGMFSTLLKTMESGPTESLPISQTEFSGLVQTLLGPPSNERALYPEFEKRGLVSLMKELSLIAPESERYCISLALQHTQFLRAGAAFAPVKDWGSAIKRINLIADHRWSLGAQVASVSLAVANLSSTSASDIERPKQCGKILLK